MTRPSRILSLLILLALPLGLMADGHIKTVKKIIIDGEEAAAGDLEMIEEIIEKIDGDKRTRIVIARDHEGDVEVEAHEGHHMALAPRRGHHGGVTEPTITQLRNAGNSDKEASPSNTTAKTSASSR